MMTSSPLNGTSTTLESLQANGSYLMVANNNSRSLGENVAISFVVGGIQLLSFFGNALIIACVYSYRRLRSEVGSVFIVNLSVTDMLSALVVISSSFYSVVEDGWNLGWGLCDLVCCMNYTLIIVSMLTLCYISVDRYVAVVHALRYHDLMTKKAAAMIIAWAWFQGICFGSMPVALGWVRYDYWEIVCAIQWHVENHATLIYVIVAFVLCFFIPGVVLSILYCKVMSVANAHYKRRQQRGIITNTAIENNNKTSTVAKTKTSKPIKTRKPKIAKTKKPSVQSNGTPSNNGVRTDMASSADLRKKSKISPVKTIEKESQNYSLPVKIDSRQELLQTALHAQGYINDSYEQCREYQPPAGQVVTSSSAEKTSARSTIILVTKHEDPPDAGTSNTTPSTVNAQTTSLSVSTSPNTTDKTISFTKTSPELTEVEDAGGHKTVDQNETSQMPVVGGQVESPVPSIVSPVIPKANTLEATSNANSRWKKLNYSVSTKALRSLMVIVLAYFICMTPFSVTKLYKVIYPSRTSLPGYVNVVASIFQYCSSAINPLIYGIFRKDFRIAFRVLLRKLNLSRDTGNKNFSMDYSMELR